MSAGRRDKLIAFERKGQTQEDSGQEIEDWSEIGRAWAKVFHGRGDERREAAMTQGSQAATFVVPDCLLTRSVRVRDRIAFDGGNWDVKANNDPQPGEREITAVRGDIGELDNADSA